uniref:Uncharacterized protein n=1 Tax=Arundo donax TaxID=35708 RepID=A0A0A9AMW0_ARUDO
MLPYQFLSQSQHLKFPSRISCFTQ